MKKLLSALLAMTLMLTLAACGGNGDGSGGGDAAQAPDLQAYFDDLMAGYGENAPSMMDVSQDTATLESIFPGLEDYELKQSVFQMAMISAVAYEIDLVGCANESDVEAVKGIFQSRIDSQIESGAFYPATVEAWQNAELIVNGNVVALIVAGEDQAQVVEAFNDLFA